MACFLVSAAEAVVVTAVEKAEEKREVKSAPKKETVEKIPFSRKLKWLTWLLWGGAILLAFEHVWHGEVVPWFPFLTAAESPESTSEMLHEMSTVGVTMAALVTVVWLAMVAVSSLIEKRAQASMAAQE